MAVQNVDVKTVVQWLEQDDAILIDVREQVEHASACIECATLLPLSNLHNLELPEFKNKKVVVHCRSGKRSQQACELFFDKHPEVDFYNLDGGIIAWQIEGQQVKKNSKKVLPLDQQVQLTIGLVLLISVLIAFVISINFIVIPALVGLGLVFAGLTGNCYLGLLLAKMPWNQVEKIQTSSCASGKK